MVVESDCTVNDASLLYPILSRQVWMQAIGRLLYQAGYGSIQFFIPLIFVNQVGLSATVVGIGIGVGSLAGIAGHFLGGYLADSPRCGRKRALLFAGGLSIAAAIVLALTQALPLLVIANLLLGLSAGCYWTAADVAVIDVTPAAQRHQAFAVLVLADSLGGGLSILAGGVLLACVAPAQMLFLMSGLVLLVFLVLIQAAIVETRQNDSDHQLDPLPGFVAALNDRSLQLFLLVNVLFTTDIALVNSTLPLYFTRIAVETASSISVVNLFTWCYLGFGAVLQLPLVQILSSWLGVRVLMMSIGLWSVGFLLVWLAGGATSLQMIWIITALSVLSVATAIYKPFAPTIVAELAPKSLRGAYLAMSYQCWSIGFFLGPILGGWAMDQSQPIAHHFWPIVSITTLCGFFILHRLGQRPTSDASALALPQASEE